MNGLVDENSIAALLEPENRRNMGFTSTEAIKAVERYH